MMPCNAPVVVVVIVVDDHEGECEAINVGKVCKKMEKCQKTQLEIMKKKKKTFGNFLGNPCQDRNMKNEWK